MVPKICSIEACSKRVIARGWCDAHYSRWQRNGSPLASKLMPSAEERFWAKVDKTEGCWVWTAGKTVKGYGSFGAGPGRTKQAHRYAMEVSGVEIPKGMTVDHICFNRLCVRPEHLRLATFKQNNEHRQGANANNVTSGVRGVCLDRGKWKAQIKHNGIQHTLGRFDTIEEAAEMARQKRLELFTYNDLDRVKESS